MTLEQQLDLLITAIGGDYKALNLLIGNLANLQTTQKTNLVSALNEVFNLANTGGAAELIDDTVDTGTGVVYSVTKIKSEIAAAKLAVKNELLNGAGAAYDTLKEIEDYLTSNANIITGITTAISKRVSIEAQSFTTQEQNQARANIGAYGLAEIGNPDTDLLALYNAAKA